MTALQTTQSNNIERLKLARGLDEILMALNCCGGTSLSRLSNGWWCRVDMFLSAKGSTFQIETLMIPQKYPFD